MFYVDAAKVKDLIAQSEKSDDHFRAHAGISNQAFYRIVFLGGPIRGATLKKVSATLGVPPASLLDQKRTPPNDAASIIGETNLTEER